MLGAALVQRGHEVVRWCSAHNHKQGNDRVNRSTSIAYNDHYTFNLIKCFFHYTDSGHGIYRLLNIYVTSFVLLWRFLSTTSKNAPDVIVCSMPAPITCAIAVFYGKLKRIPVVLDARDMWPDVFVLEKGAVSFKLRLLAALMRIELRYACKGATALSGITKFFLDYLIKYSGRDQSSLDFVLPIGYESQAQDGSDDTTYDNKHVNFWSKKGVDFNKNEAYIYFAGTLNNTVLNAIPDVMNAMDRAFKDELNIKLVICGKGECASRIKGMVDYLPNIVLAGHVSPDHLLYLKARSLCALLSIENRIDYQNSLSNKFFDYLSGGLPIITNLTGVPRDTIESYNIGYCYDSGEELYKILIKLCSTPTELESLRQNAKVAFETYFQSHVVYTSYSRSLEKIVLNHGKQ
ncbi:MULTISPECIES: glycosyltransferase [unclassified Ketobacter]|uniref:glycosyltransferase n=1 Tax=unclassified Ketobacter TaxID=2639109 RepID=UPI0025BE2E17|nr:MULTISPECIES: glycosyltransferase [unclassified Ketobacter]